MFISPGKQLQSVFGIIRQDSRTVFNFVFPLIVLEPIVDLQTDIDFKLGKLRRGGRRMPGKWGKLGRGGGRQDTAQLVL